MKGDKNDSYQEFHLVIHYEKKYEEVMNAFAKMDGKNESDKRI